MCIDTGVQAVKTPDKNNGEEKRILVLGLGNLLLRDEGVGVHAVKMLQESALPENVEVIDGGTAAMDVILLANHIDKLIVIDALKAGKEAGTIYKTCLKEQEKQKLTEVLSQNNSKISLHQVGLLDALNAAEKMNCAPDEIVIIGIEPDNINCGLELTGSVKRSLSKIIENVLEEIEK